MVKGLKLSSVRKLKKLPAVLSKGEKALIAFFVLILLTFFSYKTLEGYFQNTVLSPRLGGEYTEGVVGVPRYVNPIISQANEVDGVISNLVYSSLFRFGYDGRLKNDLVDSYQIAADQKSYRLDLKKNIKWQDGFVLSADDIVYTAAVIEDPGYHSPATLRASLEGLTFEKVDDYTLDVKTKTPFGQTLSVLTFGILPKHIWESVGPDNFALAQYNLRPIGSGPYVFDKYKKDKSGKILSYQLKVNDNYYDTKPFIETLIFKFYDNEDDVIAAYNKEEVLAVAGVSPSKASSLSADIGKLYSINMPRYFSVFFNQTKSKALSDKIVRTALAYSADKKYIIGNVFKGYAQPLEGPYPAFLPGYNPNTKIYDFARDHAKNILEAQGWKDTNNDGVREKDGVNLEFTLVTGDDPELVAAANALSELWAKMGAKVEVKTYPVGELTQNYIKNRDYEAVLFGEMLSLDPNPFVFWHSSERKYPGLNLAGYSNKDADKLLEDAETLSSAADRADKYRQFQAMVIDDVPAVFLYNPYYLYAINHNVKGVDIKVLPLPDERLSNMASWYISTDRVWK